MVERERREPAVDHGFLGRPVLKFGLNFLPFPFVQSCSLDGNDDTPSTPCIASDKLFPLFQVLRTHLSHLYNGREDGLVHDKPPS